MNSEVLVTGNVSLPPADAGAFSNRFLLVSVAVQRVLQIRGGSRPRVDHTSRKATTLAVAEVVAGSVPYILA
jgi:DNA-directed RNA polymerase subunit K/omega